MTNHVYGLKRNQVKNKHMKALTYTGADIPNKWIFSSLNKWSSSLYNMTHRLEQVSGSDVGI